MHHFKKLTAKIREKDVLSEDPASQTRADKALARRLLKLFEGDLSLAAIKDLQFYVCSGHVEICGAVDHDLDCELLVSAVKRVKGVAGVTTKMLISDSRSRGRANVFPHLPA